MLNSTAKNGGKNMSEKKPSIVNVLLLSILLLLASVPFASSMTIQDGMKTNANSRWDYLVNPKYVPWSYTGGGFLYNTVAELRAAYDLEPLYDEGITGEGQTVVIVDAYGSPTIYEDLIAFDTWHELPWTTMDEVQNHLHIYYPTGKPAFNPLNWPLSEIGWSIETTLDVCMVHAIAPGADIALVVASTPAGNVINLAVNYAITHHLGCVISQSFGIPEYVLKANNAQIKQSHYNYWLASQPEYSITVFASTGDDGATNDGPYNNALYPASDPYCTGVGGTNLFMECSDGYLEGTSAWDGKYHFGVSYSYEIAGNDYEGMAADGYPYPSDIVTTGGAMSTWFPLPDWQSGITLTLADGTTVTLTGRCTSDVSFDSGVYGGLGPIRYSAYAPWADWYIIGGTSAGSPFWAALTALACQAKGGNIGYINPTLYAFYGAYATGAFHDITDGDNTYPHGGSILGYKATIGWDAPTGIGSPDAAILVLIMAEW